MSRGATQGGLICDKIRGWPNERVGDRSDRAGKQRLAERAHLRSVGQSEGNNPVGRSPVQKACPLRGFPPDKREGHRGIRLPAMGASGGSCGLTSK